MIILHTNSLKKSVDKPYWMLILLKSDLALFLLDLHKLTMPQSTTFLSSSSWQQEHVYKNTEILIRNSLHHLTLGYLQLL